jgi:hypothetical protein
LLNVWFGAKAEVPQGPLHVRFWLKDKLSAAPDIHCSPHCDSLFDFVFPDPNFEFPVQAF